ncbi:MAG: hypothetical protein R6U50_15335 [Desulfobacterales bacterium]
MTINLKKRISKRERYALYAAVFVIGAFVLIQFIVTPMMNKKTRLIRELDIKTKTLVEMQQLKAEYEALNRGADMAAINFENRDEGFTLFSFLDRLSGRAGIKAHITYMKPTTVKEEHFTLSQVELKLKAINLKQLTTYLYMIETSKNMVFVRRLSIAQSSNPQGYIDVIMQVETFEM